MTEDMQWHMGTLDQFEFMGEIPYWKISRCNDLLAAAKKAIIPPAKAIVNRFFADGKQVNAECTGQNMTTVGKPATITIAGFPSNR